jgi:ferrous iron transport protein B
VTLVVVDATRLERNLNLVLQVLEITDRVVLCLNLMDEARRHRMTVDDRSLARDLGIPVVPMAARQGEGMEELLKTLGGVASGDIGCAPRRLPGGPPELRQAVSALVKKIQAVFPDLPNARWVALRLLDGDERIMEAVRKHELGGLRQEPAGSPSLPAAAVGVTT